MQAHEVVDCCTKSRIFLAFREKHVLCYLCVVYIMCNQKSTQLKITLKDVMGICCLCSTLWFAFGTLVVHFSVLVEHFGVLVECFGVLVVHIGALVGCISAFVVLYHQSDVTITLYHG